MSRRGTLGLGAAVAVTAVVVGFGPPALAQVRGVTVGSFYFEDASEGDGQVVVDVGDQITFTLSGRNSHSATVEGLFDSGRRSDGQTFTTGALTRAGTYTLFCTVHGESRHSTTLVVRKAAQPAATAAPTQGTAPKATAQATPKATAAVAGKPSAAATATATASVPASPSATPSPTLVPGAPAADDAADTGTSGSTGNAWLGVLGAILLAAGAWWTFRRLRGRTMDR